MRRGDLLERIRTERQWDLLIIGGGATGLGAAVDAATRGYRTLLLEAHDFAKGTSSRSTKLIHGGVRYLAQGRINLVRQALHERGVLRRNAPHLVREMPFVIPIYRRFSSFYYLTGLKLYDRLSRSTAEGGCAARFSGSRKLSRDEALRFVPTLRPHGLRGGVLYHDAQFDDARLAISLMGTAIDHGATAVNYMRISRLLKSNDRVAGAVAEDVETGEQFEIHARAVINATGVFADSIRRMDDPQSPAMLAPSQGIHLVLDRSFLPREAAMMIPKTADGRVLFAIPWLGRVVVGTTDTPVSQVSFEPRPLEREIQFILSHVAHYLSQSPQKQDVLSVFAGLRPLIRRSSGARTASLSREHALVVSESGLLTITGGKWTTYRVMAAEAVDEAACIAQLPPRPCVTADLKLKDEAGRMKDERQPLHPRLPYTDADVIRAARHELARTVEDVLSRRTRALLLDARASIEAASRVAELLAQELGHDPAWQAAQVRHFESLANGYLCT